MEPVVRSSPWSSLSPTADFYYRPAGEILTGSFRIVSILPGLPDDPIQCRVLEVSLHTNTVPFVALSYCWNSTTAEEVIRCDGRPMRVTQNLFAALRNARATSNSVNLWVDQICIDQSSLIDRNQQVSKMGAIYHAAAGVVVWLGAESTGTAGGMELPRRIRKYWPELYVRPELLTDTASTPDHVPHWGSSQWSAFLSLLSRPWFRRLWIIQEIVCAKEIFITCGTATAPWDEFVNLVGVVDALHHKKVNIHRMLGSKTTAQYIGFMQELRTITARGERPAVRDYASEDCMAHHVLTMAKDCEATDHRDKLFAFHHLVRLWNRPDYAIDIALLYNLFAVQYLQRIAYAISEYSCDVNMLFRRQLDFVYSAGASNQRLSLPSWVPDWSVPWQAQPLWLENDFYHAGGRESKELVPLAETDGIGNHRFRLPLDTKLVDRVLAVTSDGLRVAGNGSHTVAEALTAWIFQARNLLHIHRDLKCPYEDQTTAIARTIFADQVDGRRLTPEYALRRYDALLESLRQSDELGPLAPGPEALEYERFYLSVATYLRGRVFFVTESGRYGLAQAGAVSWGDEVAVIHGGPLPVIVRPIETASSSHEYRFLCDTYVLGIMDGEAWSDSKKETTRITLV